MLQSGWPVATSQSEVAAKLWRTLPRSLSAIASALAGGGTSRSFGALGLHLRRRRLKPCQCVHRQSKDIAGLAGWA